jgi:hypothetical protein
MIETTPKFDSLGILKRLETPGSRPMTATTAKRTMSVGNDDDMMRSPS